MVVNQEMRKLIKSIYLINRKIFALLVNIFANYDTKIKFFNIFYLLCISNFLLNNNANLF